MGRRAAPWTVYSKNGVAWINASIGKFRARKSLGLPFVDPGSPGHADKIRSAAQKTYAALIEGRSVAPTDRIKTPSTLSELISFWLAEDARDYPASAKLTATHAAHFEAFASQTMQRSQTPLERIANDAGPTDYVLHRLRAVLKETVIKEVSTLFRFYTWAKKREHFATLPPRPEWPKKAIGVRSGTQRAAPVETTHEETLAIIAAMPEWTARGGRNHGKKTARAIPVRDLAALAYLTSLRPSTIARLSAPEHYSKGARRLFIPPEIDKGRNKPRWVPLVKEARAILERHLKVGILFGRHDLRVQWKRAAAKVLDAARAENFSLYDFRHAAGRRMVEVSGGNLLGTAHMMGHSQLTTTNRYLAPAEHHGEAVVSALDSVTDSVTMKNSRKRGRAKRPRK